MLKLIILGSGVMGVLVLTSGIKTTLENQKKWGDMIAGQLPTAAPPADWFFICGHWVYSYSSCCEAKFVGRSARFPAGAWQTLYLHFYFLLSLLTFTVTSTGPLHAACLFSSQLDSPRSWIQLAAVTKLQQNPPVQLCFRWPEGTGVRVDHTGWWEGGVCFYSTPGKLSLPGSQLWKLEGHWENSESH